MSFSDPRSQSFVKITALPEEIDPKVEDDDGSTLLVGRVTVPGRLTATCGGVLFGSAIISMVFF